MTYTECPITALSTSSSVLTWGSSCLFFLQVLFSFFRAAAANVVTVTEPGRKHVLMLRLHNAVPRFLRLHSLVTSLLSHELFPKAPPGLQRVPINLTLDVTHNSRLLRSEHTFAQEHPVVSAHPAFLSV